MSDDNSPSRVQIWAMAHPIRFRIFELLGEGPSTASRIGRRLNESSGSTSYHLRSLARTGAIVDAPELGSRRERWWRRAEQRFLIPTDSDPEGRAIGARMFAVIFARDDEVRRRFVTREIDAAWQEGSFAGNWRATLTPEEAGELGVRLLELFREFRDRPDRPAGGVDALVSISVLPWLE
jgi:DNA-binding transcriptional ArsR family regulator